MNNPRLVLILLRIGVALVFAYAGIASFLAPDVWISYIPTFLSSIFPGQILLMGFAIYEIVLALWILSGWKTFMSALLSSLTLLAIIGANYTLLDVLFRDFAILFASLALAASAYPTGSNKK